MPRTCRPRPRHRGHRCDSWSRWQRLSSPPSGWRGGRMPRRRRCGTRSPSPAEEVASLCQSEQADGCYYPDSGQLISIGQDSQYSTVEEVLTHEYGHHIATNRLNDPWPAVDWGTKRWATVENVCRKTQVGLAFPGDEGEHYLKNPGESFAESYLHLNEVRKGLPETHWFYDAQFLPSKAALDAIEQDVLQPWD